MKTAPKDVATSRGGDWVMTALQIIFWYWLFGVILFGDFNSGSSNPLTWFLSLGSQGAVRPTVWKWLLFAAGPPVFLVAILGGWLFLQKLFGSMASSRTLVYCIASAVVLAGALVFWFAR